MSVTIIDITPVVSVVEVPFVIVPSGALAPVSVTAPAWGAGVFQDTETVGVSAGTYAGTAPITVSRSVERFDGASWVEVAMGVGSTYTFAVTGLHRIAETASNAEGAVTAYSAEVEVFAAGAAPTNTTPPETTADGGLAVGDVVGTCGGEWDGSGATITGYNYRYLRDGSPIAGATSSTYTLTSDDQDTELTPQVQAVTSVGVSSWVSADAVSILTPGGDTGRIYPATLTLYATHDPTGMLVGAPTLDANGDITVTIASGGLVSIGDSAALYFTLERDSAGESVASPLPLGQYLAAFSMLIEGPSGAALTNPGGGSDRVIYACGIISDPTAPPTSPTMTADTSHVVAGVFADRGNASPYLARRGTASAGPGFAFPVDYGCAGASVTSQENRTNDAQAFINSATARINSGASTSEANETSIFVHRYMSAVVWLRRITLGSDLTFAFRPSLQLVLDTPP